MRTDKESPQTIARRKANAEFAAKRLRGESNLNFSKNNEHFKQACADAGVEATARQASKFRSKKGAAYLGKGE